MNFWSELKSQIIELYQLVYKSSIPNYIIFIAFFGLSLLIGRYTSNLAGFTVGLIFHNKGKNISNNLLEPTKKDINLLGTLALIYLSINIWLKDYQSLYNFIESLTDLVLIISVAWIISRLFRQFLKAYGISLFHKFGGTVIEFLEAIEIIVNIIILLIAITAFAYSRGFPLTGLLAGISITGLAISFAAQNTLQQILGTVILFLDRPFIAGEYIRLPNDTFGRVESIGLRSTKMRTAAKGTLLIVPNSKMANWEIENVTRGKKIMMLLYLDFERLLEEGEKALVKQTIIKAVNSFFSVEPGNTNLTFFKHPQQELTRSRLTFFIFGSTEFSTELRKRLVKMSQKMIVQQLINYGIKFTINEAEIYVDSPISI